MNLPSRNVSVCACVCVYVKSDPPQMFHSAPGHEGSERSTELHKLSFFRTGSCAQPGWVTGSGLEVEEE